MRVVRGLSGFLCSCFQGQSPHLDLRPKPQGLSRADMDLGVPLGRPQVRQASSRVEPCKSALLSSHKSSVRLPVRLNIGNFGFLSRRRRAVTPPSCFESVLGVSVVSMQGTQVCLDCTGTLGVFQHGGMTPGVPLERHVETASP